MKAPDFVKTRDFIRLSLMGTGRTVQRSLEAETQLAERKLLLCPGSDHENFAFSRELVCIFHAFFWQLATVLRLAICFFLFGVLGRLWLLVLLKIFPTEETSWFLRNAMVCLLVRYLPKNI